MHFKKCSGGVAFPQNDPPDLPPTPPPCQGPPSLPPPTRCLHRSPGKFSASAHVAPCSPKTRPPRPVCSSPGREPVLSLSTSPAGLVMTQPVEILGELMEGGRKARVSPGPQSPCGLPYFYFFQLPGTNGLHPSKSLKRGCQAHSEKEGMACPAPPRRPLWPCAE